MIEIEKRMALIHQHPCFASLSEEDIGCLAELCFQNRYNSGEVIISEGDLVDSVYLIAKGEIEVDCKTKGLNEVQPIPEAVMREGDAIGLSEAGFFSQTGLRMASLIAISEVILIGWSLDIFHHFLEAHPEFQVGMKSAAGKMLCMNFIKQAAPFADLPMETLKKLAEEIEEIFTVNGEILFEQGDEADKCYLICAGEVEIYLRQAEGGEKILARLEPWRLFGESALLSTAKRNSSARASQAGKLLVLKLEQLEELMAHHNTAESIMALIVDHSRPTQAENIQHYHRENEEGQPFTILKDKKRGQYYQLSQEGWFIWQQLDGQKNLQDITIELYKKLKIFAPAAVADTVLNLADAGFAILPEIHASASKEPLENSSLWQKIKKHLHPWHYFQYIIYDLDPWISATYRGGVHLFFSLWGQILMAGISLIGMMFFAIFLPNLVSKIPPLLHIAFLLIALFLAHLSLTLFHELAHGYTTKYFKHEVHRAGIIFTFFGLAAFVDTSDMWLSSRGPRILVSLAGPYMDVFMAGIFAIVAYFIPQAVLSLFFWLLALTLYVSVFKNINPLRENDGYYVLRDALKESNLQFLALNWLKKIRFKTLENPLKVHKNESLYWLTCLAFLLLALLLAFVAQHYLRLVLPASILGISTTHLIWLLPGLVIVNFVLTVSKFLRNL